MRNENEMEMKVDSHSENEAFIRVAVAAFMTQMDPTLEEVADVKTAVSEAVTNCIIHGYENHSGKIEVLCRIKDHEIYIEIRDYGKGIADIEKAMEPMYTTKPDLERSGMGFAFMEAFMNELQVESVLGKGTCIKMKKKLSKGSGTWNTPSL